MGNGSCVFDIEADGLLVGSHDKSEATKIHCIVIKDIDGGIDITFRSDLTSPLSIEDGISHLGAFNTLIGHNIAGFDIPLVKKLYGIDLSDKVIEDTMLMSQIINPDGQHSLEALGAQAGSSATKIANEDWSVISDKMVDRCSEDVKLTEDVYEMLKPQMDEADKEGNALPLEVKIALIHAKQVQHGVFFDTPKALALLDILDDEMNTLQYEILKDAPRRTIETHPGPIDAPYAKSGKLCQRAVKWFDGDIPNIKGPFSRVEFREVNLNSDKEVKELLLQLGWKPTEWNYSKATRLRTSPKLTEDSYHSLPSGLGKKVAELNIRKHRRRMLLNMKDPSKGAIPSVRADGRVTADAITCGTNTARYRHQGTVCNIPRPTTPYGPELRELFRVPPGCFQIGLDLKGIEARMLAHYLKAYPGHEATVKRILDGDFHDFNAKTWGVDRDTGKGGFYALLYGCKAPKLADVLGKPVGEGNKLMNAFWRINPIIKRLVDDLEAAYAAHPGYIYGLDGRRLVIRDKRKLLNTLLQNAAAIVFKEWMVKCDGYMVDCKFDIHQIISYHDELQTQIRTLNQGDAEEAAECMCLLIKEVEGEMKIKVPLEVDFRVGKNWRDCH